MRTHNHSQMPTRNIIRWGLIGCGEATERRGFPAFSAHPDCEVVAVMSREIARAKAFAQKHDIARWYNDAQNLVTDPDVDAVYIATPPSTHATYAVMALNAGKVVYVEKPLAISYDECLRINRVAASTKLACFVAYYRRYLPYFKKVDELIKSGTIGRVLTAQIRFAAPPREMDYSSTNRPWRLQPDIAGGGYFYDLAPHQIDILQHLFGPITEAVGYPANRGGLYKTEDTVAATMRFMGGMPASGTWCFVAHESAREDRILVIGDKGQLSFSVFTYNPIHIQNEDGEQHIKVETPDNVQLPLLSRIVEHLQGGRICECDSVSATPTNWVIDRILGKLN